MSKKKKKVDASKKYFNPRVRAELWDADYLDTLSEKDRNWYLKFMSESVNATIEVVKDPLVEEYSKLNNITYKRARKEMIGGGYTPIKKEGQPTKGHLHKTKEQKKKIFDENNSRNNDLYGVTKINNLLEYDINSMSKTRDIWHEGNPETTEEAMLTLIDFKRDPSKYNDDDSN